QGRHDSKTRGQGQEAREPARRAARFHAADPRLYGAALEAAGSGDRHDPRRAEGGAKEKDAGQNRDGEGCSVKERAEEGGSEKDRDTSNRAGRHGGDGEACRPVHLRQTERAGQAAAEAMSDATRPPREDPTGEPLPLTVLTGFL